VNTTLKYNKNGYLNINTGNYSLKELDKISELRQKTGLGTSKYPYKYSKYMRPIVLERDDYTCQNCGYYGLKKVEYIEEEYSCSITPFNFHPNLNWGPPKFCRLPYKPKKCGECKKLEKKIIKYQYNDLVVHHIDHNPCNNKKENLMTLCNKCHNLKPFRQLGEKHGSE